VGGGSLVPGAEISFGDAGSEIAIRSTSGSGAVYYNFDQFLYTTKDVTPDIQVIAPVGRQATIAFLTGLRLQMRF
jgi:hypothetical protein